MGKEKKTRKEQKGNIWVKHEIIRKFSKNVMVYKNAYEGTVNFSKAK